MLIRARHLLIFATLVHVSAAGAQESGDSAAATPLRPSLHSWTSPPRHYPVGTLLTVLISERTVASDAGDARNGSSRSTDIGGSASMGAAAPIPGGALSAGYDRQESSVEAISRRDQFVGDLAVRVMEITPEGLLRIEGEREVRIDNRKRTLRLEGLVRASDIEPRGYVSSSRVANAVIEYKGGPSRFRAGFLGRVLGALWPF